MREFRVLVYSYAPSLVQTIRRAAQSHKCVVETRPIVCAASTSGYELVVSHLTGPQDISAAQAMLASAKAKGLLGAKSLPRYVFVLDQPNHREEYALRETGASEVMTRPLDLNRLSYLMGSVALDLEAQRLLGRRQTITPNIENPTTLTLETLQAKAFGHGILFRSQRMLDLMDQLRHVIRRDSTILLSGETGTGKTQLAHLIHTLSPRSAHPFVVANCAALTPSLLESELFGHARGAFTGATQAYDGKFHAADAGTIFLDEIDSLPQSGQQRLLRVLDQRVFEKVGSNESQELRARIIAAANRPLEQLVANGDFRSDLYYRLMVATAHMPPLRERPEDIAPIAMHVIADEARREGEPIPDVDNELLEKLSEYQWPGNIRELRNVISQMILLSGGQPLSVASLPRRLTEPVPLLPPTVEGIRTGEAPPAPFEAKQPLGWDGKQNAPVPVGAGSMRPLELERARSEANRILHELKRNNYNRTKTAQSLGISRAALHKKLKKLTSIGLM